MENSTTILTGLDFLKFFSEFMMIDFYFGGILWLFHDEGEEDDDDEDDSDDDADG